MTTTAAPAAAEPTRRIARMRAVLTRVVSARTTDGLWPFGLAAALALVPLLWLAIGTALWVTHKTAGWPSAASSGGVVYIAAAVGLLPVWLVLIDSLAHRKAVVTTKFLALDFSKGETEAPAAPLRLDSPGLEGTPINISSVQAIHEVLTRTTAARVLHLDLGDGESWWLTRLFALCAGAVDAGAPEALVFIGRRGDSGRTQDRAFLGWVGTHDAFRILRAAHPHLKTILDRCRAVSRLVEEATASSDPVALDVMPAGIPADVWQTAVEYIQSGLFRQLGSDTKVRILLEQLGRYEQAATPLGGERVTRGTLTQFGEALYTETIDVSWPVERRVDELLRARGRFVAETNDGGFSRLLERDVVQADLLRQLALPEPAQS